MKKERPEPSGKGRSAARGENAGARAEKGAACVRMDVYRPFSNDRRVMLWLNHWGGAAPGVGRLHAQAVVSIADLFGVAGPR